MNHEKVLIVEDEENERTGLAELITGWGYRADTARDGAEGLEKVTTWAPSIVVTDMKMPRMGGLELLEKLATDAQTMAVIVVTAQGRSTVRCRPCAWAPMTTSPSPLTPTGCAPSCRMLPRCLELAPSSKSRVASCATPALSAVSSGLPRK